MAEPRVTPFRFHVFRHRHVVHCVTAWRDDQTQAPTTTTPWNSGGPRTPEWSVGALGRITSAIIFLVALAASGVAAPKKDSTVELRNSVEELSGSSVRTFTLRLAADGVVNLDLLVHHGPAVTVHVVSRPPGASILKANEFRLFPEFSTEQVTSCRKSGWLARGEYYLTLINPAADPAIPTKVRIIACLSPGPRVKTKARE